MYEQFGSLHLYDLATRQEHAVAVSIHGDLPHLTPHLARVLPREVQNIAISPTGAAEHDAQLERAVAIVLQQLKEHPVIEPAVPPYPHYHKHDGLGTH